jgi:tricorn protease
VWSVADTGGMARRLTNHSGNEFFPHWSPDGKWIAFTGDYDGNSDVYLIPADGGEPKRLTWHPSTDTVLGWTPDGTKVLFRTTGETPYRSSALYTVSRDGGDAEMLPLGYAGAPGDRPRFGTVRLHAKELGQRDPGRGIAGGTAPDIWVGDPKKADYKKITDFDGINAYPMWNRGRIYFLSDPGGTMNIWSIKADGSNRRQETDFEDWDARQAAIAPDGRVVFTLKGRPSDLRSQNAGDEENRRGRSEDRVLTRQALPRPGTIVTSVDLSPDRIAPRHHRARRDLLGAGEARGDHSRSRAAAAQGELGALLRDGKSIVYVTDATGEERFKSVDAWDREPAKTIEPARDSGWHFRRRAFARRQVDRLRRSDAIALRDAGRGGTAQARRPQPEGRDQRVRAGAATGGGWPTRS